MLRFFLLRFLPRRLLPVLLVVEAVRFIQGWRTRNKPPVAPPAGRRARVIEVREPTVPGQAWTDRAS
ncbi:MAG TPA: hypothetical protein VGO15_11550 [Candidatus Limnocylindrales bacterium]|jgi:hypothetical protein|nr:hypothetical protein [Candidatus Limnocylindrales bacterium]